MEVCMDCGEKVYPGSKRCRECWQKTTSPKYRWIYINGKNVPEHRYVMEQYIGRPLTSDDIVHHVNHNGLDNRIENLVLTTRGEHVGLHPRTDETKRKVSESVKESWNRRSRKLKPLSEEHKHKIGLGQVGSHRTEETKRKMSESIKKSWEKRSHVHTEETKKKMRESHQKRLHKANPVDLISF